MVEFDGARIREIAESVASKVGLPEEFDLKIEIDETVPLGRIEPIEVSDSGARVKVESGAIEDPKKPRGLSESGTELAFGMLMMRVMDWVNPDFKFDGTVGEQLPVGMSIAWNTYSAGRLSRLGFERARKARYLYLWRNRHGFNDIADEAFEKIWSGEPQSWPEIVAICDEIKDQVAATTG